MKLLDLGTNIFIKGFYVEGKGVSKVILLPREDKKPPAEFLHTDEESYKKLVRQLDLQEAECFDYHHGTRHIVRRTQRNLDQNISWAVFKRDNYQCRYCGVDGVPMSYDHIHLWEKGGMNTMENGVCACKKCNQKRGNTDYREWINSDIYKRISFDKITSEVRRLNEELIDKYESFKHRVSRRKR